MCICTYKYIRKYALDEREREHNIIDAMQGTLFFHNKKFFRTDSQLWVFRSIEGTDDETDFISKGKDGKWKRQKILKYARARHSVFMIFLRSVCNNNGNSKQTPIKQRMTKINLNKSKKNVEKGLE